MMRHVAFSAVVAALSASAVFAAEVKVDLARETGIVKPVNGVGQPPFVGIREFTLVCILERSTRKRRFPLSGVCIRG